MNCMEERKPPSVSLRPLTNKLVVNHWVYLKRKISLGDWNGKRWRAEGFHSKDPLTALVIPRSHTPSPPQPGPGVPTGSGISSSRKQGLAAQRVVPERVRNADSHASPKTCRSRVCILMSPPWKEPWVGWLPLFQIPAWNTGISFPGLLWRLSSGLSTPAAADGNSVPSG